jgi:hypothetical protein
MAGCMTFDAPSDNTTMTDVIASFEADGFTGVLEIGDDGCVVCLACGGSTDPSDVPLFAIRRLEGASDPADMAAVMTSRCPHCSTPSVIVARYGPEASAGEASLLANARDQRWTAESGGDTAPGAGVSTGSNQPKRNA